MDLKKSLNFFHKSVVGIIYCFFDKIFVTLPLSFFSWTDTVVYLLSCGLLKPHH